jgi:hypothetical protein
MEGKNNLLVPKFDFLWKHASCYKTLVTMLGVKKGKHYFLKNIQRF